MKRVRKVLNNILLYGFFIIGVILLFYGSERISTMLVAFGSFIISIIFAYILKIKRINNKYWLFINLALVLNFIGEFVVYYSGIFIYDKILHFSLGLLLSAIIYDYYKNNSQLNKDAIVITVIGLLAIWEIYEFCMDTFFGFQSQGVLRNELFIQSALNDTFYDLIWGALGSLSYLFFKKEKLDRVIIKDIKKIKKVANPKKLENSFIKFIKNILSWKII